MSSLINGVDGMGKNPWMKFYVKDYLMDIDVKALSYEEKGLYTDMLFLMWDNGGFLPGDMSELSKILGISCKKFTKKFQKISKFFQKVETDGKVFLTQKRLNKEWNEAERINNKRRQAGQKGGVTTREKYIANAIANDQQTLQQTESKRPVESESESESDKTYLKDLKHISDLPDSDGKKTRTEKQPKYSMDSPEFLLFWNAYPPERRIEKLKAFNKWEETLKNKKLNATPERLAMAAENYRKECVAEGREAKFIKHPATFLSKANAPWLHYADLELKQFGRTLYPVNEKDFFDSTTGKFDSTGYQRALHGLPPKPKESEGKT